ncbi:amino acid racemase [Fredinandcohnia sp. QZ13]|uniref:aspartate/glutamate racemase family protein n=1 Tax=Fredinandcohnia sp. QZ13 TaxID=3073144 RepID=UPI00285322D9|nr:amino acid racemase [Fredinandcohnia sp. QZ13]MDR4887772.1 amino acid racemase [Fredinandcohnia sp. QZ13]
MTKTLGIMGGMGPLATVDLMTKIIRLTPAQNDQAHIHMIVDNYPQIPDRTSAILGKGMNPLPFMIESAKRLETAGADWIAIACNTAHYYFDEIQASVKIPLLNMPKETVRFIDKVGLKTIALLATDGTLSTNLYQESLHERGIVVVEPDKMTQEDVMEGIYAVKSGNLEKGKKLLLQASKTVIAQGAEAIIAACTEIPLVLSEVDGFKVIDPTEIVAKKIVDMCYE